MHWVVLSRYWILLLIVFVDQHLIHGLHRDVSRHWRLLLLYELHLALSLFAFIHWLNFYHFSTNFSRKLAHIANSLGSEVLVLAAPALPIALLIIFVWFVGINIDVLRWLLLFKHQQVVWQTLNIQVIFFFLAPVAFGSSFEIVVETFCTLPATFRKIESILILLIFINHSLWLRLLIFLMLFWRFGWRTLFYCQIRRIFRINCPRQIRCCSLNLLD